MEAGYKPTEMAADVESHDVPGLKFDLINASCHVQELERNFVRTNSIISFTPSNNRFRAL